MTTSDTLTLAGVWRAETSARGLAAGFVAWVWRVALTPLREWRGAGMARLVALVVALVLVADAALCALIVARVPYTEIDWRAYMAQVRARSSAGGGDGRFARSSGS